MKAFKEQKFNFTMVTRRRTGAIVRSNGSIHRYSTEEDLSPFERDLQAALSFEVTAYGALVRKDTLLQLSLASLGRGEYSPVLEINDNTTSPSRPSALLTIMRLASALQQDLAAYRHHFDDNNRDISSKEVDRRRVLYEQLKTSLQEIQDRVTQGLETIVSHEEVM